MISQARYWTDSIFIGYLNINNNILDKSSGGLDITGDINVDKDDTDIIDDICGSIVTLVYSDIDTVEVHDNNLRQYNMITDKFVCI